MWLASKNANEEGMLHTELIFAGARVQITQIGKMGETSSNMTWPENLCALPLPLLHHPQLAPIHGLISNNLHLSFSTMPLLFR